MKLQFFVEGDGASNQSNTTNQQTQQTVFNPTFDYDKLTSIQWKVISNRGYYPYKLFYAKYFMM